MKHIYLYILYKLHTVHFYAQISCKLLYMPSVYTVQYCDSKTYYFINSLDFVSSKQTTNIAKT